MAEIYWIGMEDLPFSNTDKDYNDMIVKVSQVPVPEPATMLLLGSGSDWTWQDMEGRSFLRSKSILTNNGDVNEGFPD